MSQPDTILIPWLGLNVQGDLGPWTFYQSSRGPRIWFVKAPPLMPPTPAQISVMNQFRLAAYNWRALEPQRRADWLSSAKRAKLRITGYNLFVYWQLKGDDATIRTVERLSGLQLIG